MHTVDQIAIGAPMDRVFQFASDVERWPEILSHYRWVRFLDRHASGGTVEMAAWRPFGALRYPVWWVSEMTVDGRAREIRYRHVRGITQRMDVVWRLVEEPAGVAVTIVHDWGGPGVAGHRSVGRPPRDRAGIHPRDRVPHPGGHQTVRGGHVRRLGQVRNAERGMRNCSGGSCTCGRLVGPTLAVIFRTPHSAFRI